jgi:hypothetical protein
MVHGVKKENKGPLSEATSISIKKVRDLSSVLDSSAKACV